jgi:hypothetical protein
MLVLVVRLEENRQFDGHLFDDRLREEIVARNRRLADFKRVGGYLLWERDFPRTASLKIKRGELATEIGTGTARTGVVGI